MTDSEKITAIIEKSEPWARDIQLRLRDILLQSGLREAVKWGGPAYLGKSQVASFGAFKHWVALWFNEGAILSDHAGKLVAAGEKTIALRQWRMTKDEEIEWATVKAYVAEAALNDEQGRKTPKPKAKPLDIPEELKAGLDRHPDLRAYFESIPPSHRKEFCLHVAEAKRPETRISRAEKCLELMKQGKDLHHKYKK
jgi:uncharacterized protein YdeI (YjbR/CyaY-like superfamily)